MNDLKCLLFVGCVKPPSAVHRHAPGGVRKIAPRMKTGLGLELGLGLGLRLGLGLEL